MRVKRNEDGGSEGAGRICNSLRTQTVSSYVFLPSLLIFIPKMLRQEYKAGCAGSDDLG